MKVQNKNNNMSNNDNEERELQSKTIECRSLFNAVVSSLVVERIIHICHTGWGGFEYEWICVNAIYNFNLFTINVTPFPAKLSASNLVN